MPNITDLLKELNLLEIINTFGASDKKNIIEAYVEKWEKIVEKNTKNHPLPMIELRCLFFKKFIDGLGSTANDTDFQVQLVKYQSVLVKEPEKTEKRENLTPIEQPQRLKRQQELIFSNYLHNEIFNHLEKCQKNIEMKFAPKDILAAVIKRYRKEMYRESLWQCEIIDLINRKANLIQEEKDTPITVDTFDKTTSIPTKITSINNSLNNKDLKEFKMCYTDELFLNLEVFLSKSFSNQNQVGQPEIQQKVKSLIIENKNDIKLIDIDTTNTFLQRMAAAIADVEGFIQEISQLNQAPDRREKSHTVGKIMFVTHLYLLSKKKGDLDFRKEKAARQAASSLHRKLKKEEQSYFGENPTVNFKRFKQNCEKHINEARKTLDKHRGWSELLTNLLLGILSVGVGLLIKGVINRANNRSFFFVHKTDSAKKLDAIENCIRDMKIQTS